MAKYNIGDEVICIKYGIGQHTTFSSNGMREENYVDARFFNMKGKIANTYKNYMENFHNTEFEDKGEYEIEFENGTTLAWVKDEELIPLMVENSMINAVCKEE